MSASPPLAADVGAWAQVATAIVAVGGLIGLLFQLRALTGATSMTAKATTMAAYQSFAALMVDVDRLMIERSDLRAYIYDGHTPSHEDPVLHGQAEAVAEMFVDLADLVFQLKEVMPPGTAESWFDHFRRLAEGSQVMTTFMRRYATSYPEAMVRELFPWALEAPVEQPPPPPAGTAQPRV